MASRHLSLAVVLTAIGSETHMHVLRPLLFATMLCLGCGDDLKLRKAYERRALGSTQGEQVREMYKEVLSLRMALCGVHLDVHSMIGTEDNPGYMCPCFDKYKSLAKLHNEMLQKVEIDLSKIVSTSGLPTTYTLPRKRTGCTLQEPPSKQLHVVQKQSSPAVVVS